MPWDAKQQCFDETKLLEAMNSGDVLGYEMRWTMIDDRECPVVTLRMVGGKKPGGADAPRGSWKSAVENKPGDPRREEAMKKIRFMEEQMPPDTKDAFYKLKAWRSEKVKESGAPAYSVANNMQLVELSFRAPKTMAEIKAIRGLGGAFCKNYGEEVLDMLKALPSVPYKLPEGEGEGEEGQGSGEEVKGKREEQQGSREEVNGKREEQQNLEI